MSHSALHCSPIAGPRGPDSDLGPGRAARVRLMNGTESNNSTGTAFKNNFEDSGTTTRQNRLRCDYPPL
eukprot:546270-Hanusia_phi.AAC.1